MITLYSEIKNYVVRIKTLLSKALETHLDGTSDENETRLIIFYLLTLGEDRQHLRSLYLKLKVQSVKKRLAAVPAITKATVSMSVYRRASALMIREPISDAQFDQLLNIADV